MEEFNQQNNEEGNNLSPSDNNPEIEATIHPVAAALIGLFGGFFLYQIVGGMATLLVFGFDIENAPANGVRLMTMAGQILFILLPALILAKVIYFDVSSIIRFKFPEWKETGLFTLGMILITPLLQNYLYIQNYLIEIVAAKSETIQKLKSIIDQLNELIEQTYGNLLTPNNPLEVALIFLVVAITPAICEEVMFRGYIQKSFELKIKPVWSALITAIFFGLYHFNPYGIIPLIALGFFFGYSAYKSNSIFIPVLLHFLNNFFAVTAFLIYGEEEFISEKIIEEIDISFTIAGFLISLLLFSALIFYINKYYRMKQNKGEENAFLP